MAKFEVVLASQDGRRGADFVVEADDADGAVAVAQGDSPGYLTVVQSVTPLED